MDEELQARYGTVPKFWAHKLATGYPPEVCPFGCRGKDLDDYGYCKHLVGFSPDGKALEVLERGKEYPVVRYVPAEQVRPTDHLVQITTSYRVYRSVGGVAEKSGGK